MNTSLKVKDELVFDKDQVELIKNTVAKGATENELKLFLYQAKRAGLDPLARQIYFVKRMSKNGPIVTIQTSIDGFRIIAERSGFYAGQDEPIFEEKDGKLIKCTVRVYRFSPKGERYMSSVGVAYWDEYKPAIGQDFMWLKMPHLLLSKVSEAIALRKSFPQDLSGIYTSDEMVQATPVDFHSDVISADLKVDQETPKNTDAIVDEYLSVETKICPNCGKKMILRDGKFGKFWGCMGYPTCKKIESAEENPIPLQENVVRKAVKRIKVKEQE